MAGSRFVQTLLDKSLSFNRSWSTTTKAIHTSGISDGGCWFRSRHVDWEGTTQIAPLPVSTEQNASLATLSR
jgi:hypothetical protein